MVTVAGLDLSLRSAGMAVIFPDGSIETDSFGYSLTKEATTRDHVERIIWITSKIVQKIKQHSIDWVGLENYAFSRGRAGNLTVQADLGGCVKAQVLMLTKRSPVLLASTSVRAYHLSGQGKYTQRKDKVKLAIQDVLRAGGYSFSNGDEADALAVALVVRDWRVGSEGAKTKQQMALFENLDRQIVRGGGGSGRPK